MQRRQAGFTLLEMLVVVVLTALIMGLLMQVFFFVMQFRGTFLNQVETQRTALLRNSWYRQVVGHLEPVPGDDEGAFRGTGNTLEGYTLSPLNGEFGLSTPFSLRIEQQAGRSVLRYREAGGLDWVLSEWPGSEWGFRYLDHAGQWVTQWDGGRGDEGSALPAAILLTGAENGADGIWLVRVRIDSPGKPEGS